MAAAPACAPSALRSARATFAPSRAAPLAMAAPSPWAAPVTKTFLPSSRPVMSRSPLLAGFISREARGGFIHEFRQRDVLFGDAAGIVRGERDGDAVVDVEPFGVMVVLVGVERRVGHEAEGLVEIGELEILNN